MSSASPALVSIALGQLHEWPDNPRKTHDPEKHDELVASIASDGLLQPLLVRPRPADGYEVICGNRRRRALVANGGDVMVPCLVRDLDDDAALAAALKENGDRDGLLPLEEADTFERLLRSRTVEVVASLVGRSTTHVRQRVKLLSLIPIARELLVRDLLTAAAALQLAQLESPSDQARAVLLLDFEVHAGGDAVDEAESLSTLTAAQLTSVERFGGPPTAGDVRNAVSSLGRTLSRASFPILDDELVARVPSCNACPKRTGAQASLFGAAEDDTCLDATCWQQKTAAADARVVTRAEQEGRLLPAESSAQLWDRWNRLNGEGPFVAADDSIHWNMAGTYSDELTEDERKELRVAVDGKGRAHELLPRELAEAVRARAMDAHAKSKADAAGTDDPDARARMLAAAEKSAAEREKREAAAKVRGELKEKAMNLIVEGFASSAAPDSVALAIAVAATVSHRLPELLGFDRKTSGSKPMVPAIAELVRRFDADREGACAWVMRTLLERSYVHDDEQDAVLDALLGIVASRSLESLRDNGAKGSKNSKKRAKARA